jgi:hypothetical protein
MTGEQTSRRHGARQSHHAMLSFASFVGDARKSSLAENQVTERTGPRAAVAYLVIRSHDRQPLRPACGCGSSLSFPKVRG